MAATMNFGSYALIQFCPVPERLEFLNVGLFMAIPELNYHRVEFVEEPKRVQKLFGKQSQAYFDQVADATRFRLLKLKSIGSLWESFHEFAHRRANNVRLTNLLEVRIEGDPDLEFERLFEKLVESQGRRKGATRARTRLKSVFQDYRVDRLLDKPSKVDLVDFDITITAPFAYQNGSYNLIDAIRLTDSHSESLREVGKKAMEGQLLWSSATLYRQMKLIVVADFADQSEEFFNGVYDYLNHSNVKLYRFDHVDMLVDDIKRHVPFI